MCAYPSCPPWRTQRIRTQRAWLFGGLLVGMLWLGAGCAGARVVQGIYLDSENRYQIRLPAAPWISISLDGAALSFRQPALQAALAFSVECTSSEPGELPWVARHLFFGLREKRIQRREQISLHGAEGVRTWLMAELDGVPVAVEGVTARRGECLYDFMYVAPPATFARGRSDFQTFVESWTPLAKP